MSDKEELWWEHYYAIVSRAMYPSDFKRIMLIAEHKNAISTSITRKYCNNVKEDNMEWICETIVTENKWATFVYSKDGENE